VVTEEWLSAREFAYGEMRENGYELGQSPD
jgi:hypothetical protein